MAAGDLAFACGCECQECSQFLTRFVGRPWVGAFIGDALPFQNQIGLRFLRYRQTNNAHSPTRNAAQDFTTTWAIDFDHYNTSTTTGTGNTYIQVAGQPAASLLSVPGDYHITRNNASGFQVQSFSESDTYRITVHEVDSIAGSDLIVDREFTDWFSPARMTEVLERDMEDPNPSFADPVTHIAPRFSPVGISEVGFYTVGGYIDQCDGLSDSGGVAGGGARSGHAARHIIREGNPNVNVLVRTILYVGGNHRLQERNRIIDGPIELGPVIGCQNLPVPAATSYVIEPPATNGRMLTLELNQSC